MAFTLIGVVVVMNQVLLLKRFWLHRFGELLLIRVMLWISQSAWPAWVPRSSHVFHRAGGSRDGAGGIARRADESGVRAWREHRKGETIGVLSALMSAAMVVAPPLSGILFEVGHSLPFFVGVGILMLGLIVARDCRQR